MWTSWNQPLSWEPQYDEVIKRWDTEFGLRCVSYSAGPRSRPFHSEASLRPSWSSAAWFRTGSPPWPWNPWARPPERWWQKWSDSSASRTGRCRESKPRCDATMPRCFYEMSMRCQCFSYFQLIQLFPWLRAMVQKCAESGPDLKQTWAEILRLTVPRCEDSKGKTLLDGSTSATRELHQHGIS